MTKQIETDIIIKNIIDRLFVYDSSNNFNVLDEIFKNPTLTNLFLNHKEFLKILFDYITTTKNKSFYELIDYIKNKCEDVTEHYNIFKFNNGEFTNVDLKELTKSDTGEKMLNTILLFNTKQTNNKSFNEIFNKVKDVEIRNYKFNNMFNNVLLNNIHQNYKFNFMDIYTHQNLDKYTLGQLKPNVELSFKYLNLMDNYILKFNDDSKVFKMWFYILLCYVYDKPNLKFVELLNIFQNFNIIFYNKLIYPNDELTNLITYIYFKIKYNESETLKPNLRYTIDIKGNSTEDKIKYIKEYKQEEFKEFKTTIKENETGFYFNTQDYKPEDILKHCQELINDENYNELIYYIFNSQFLNRSTCLFGYFIYFYLTHKILKNTHYFDIIALTRPFDEFNELVNNNYITVEEFEKINSLTLSKVIDLIN